MFPLGTAYLGQSYSGELPPAPIIALNNQNIARITGYGAGESQPLLVRVILPNHTSVIERSVITDSNGDFELDLDITLDKPGVLQIFTLEGKNILSKATKQIFTSPPVGLF